MKLLNEVLQQQKASTMMVVKKEKRLDSYVKQEKQEKDFGVRGSNKTSKDVLLFLMVK